jgi:hypothetical protein
MSPTERPSGSGLPCEQILAALSALSEELGEEGVIGESCLFGGTVMVLAFAARIIFMAFAAELALAPNHQRPWMNRNANDGT